MRSMTDAIEIYTQSFNAHLFPLRRCVIGDKKSKHPLEPEWQTTVYPVDQLQAYLKRGHAIGWRLGPQDLVLDVDVATAERPDKKGDQVLGLLENLMGSAKHTPIVQGSTGGRHYYLKLPEGVDSTAIRTKIRELPDVDVLRFRQFVVIAGSPHWQGGHYEFDLMTQMFGEYHRQTVNDAVLNLLLRDPKIDSERIESSSVEPGLLEDILKCLDVTNFRDHVNWFGIMAACHHATEGSEDGLESFLHWSLGDPKYQGDREKIEKRWQSLDPHKTRGYTLGTLIHELREAGREDAISVVHLKMEFGDLASDAVSVPGFDELGIPGQDFPAKPPKKEYPQVEHILDEEILNEGFIKHLAARPQIYARLDQLYHMDIKGGELYSRRLESLSLCESLSACCELGDFTGKLGKWKPKRIPERVGRQLAAYEKWEGVKLLRRISPLPIMTERGIHQRPGYEPLTGLFYYAMDMADIPKVKRSPSREDAMQALEIIKDLVSEFCFAEPVHMSAWVASFLGVVGRPILGNCAPMTIVDSNRSGAGKGLLCELVSDICLGPANHPAKFTGLDKNEDEQRKMFLALARENPIIGIFDNFKSGGSIGSPVLDSILTSGHVNGRILGLTKITHAVFDSVLFANANRIQFDPGSDLLRRIFYVLLETPSESPEKRVFKYREVRAHAQKNRGKYVAAALTLLEAARLNFDDLLTVEPWGSYTGYDLVRRALVWLGEPDPRGSVSGKRTGTAPDGKRELRLVIKGLIILGCDKTSLTARQIDEKLQVNEFKDTREQELLNEVDSLLAPRRNTNRPLSIGNRLAKKYRDQALDGKWIREVGKHEDVTLWAVQDAPPQKADPT